MFRVMKKRDGSEIELSVVKKGTHGEGSWGWPGDDKIILLRDDGYSKDTIKRVEKLAHQLCDELNKCTA